MRPLRRTRRHSDTPEHAIMKSVALLVLARAASAQDDGMPDMGGMMGGGGMGGMVT